jgi:hypothetical protein
MPLRSLATASPVRHLTNEKPKGGEPPLCPKCGSRMTWFETELKRDGYSRLVHTFFCRACSESVKVEEPWKARLRSVSLSN